MATRSTIAVEHSDGTVSQIYCHWDGYIDHNGRLLENHYNTQKAVEELIKMGDVSSLGEEIGEKHSFDWWTDSKELYKQFGQGKWCTFYGRDRDEKGTEARTYPSIANYFAEAQEEEYNYIFTNGSWLVKGWPTEGKWEPLEAVSDETA